MSRDVCELRVRQHCAPESFGGGRACTERVRTSCEGTRFLRGRRCAFICLRRTSVWVWRARSERARRPTVLSPQCQVRFVTLELQHAGTRNGLVRASNTCACLEKLLIGASSDRSSALDSGGIGKAMFSSTPRQDPCIPSSSPKERGDGCYELPQKAIAPTLSLQQYTLLRLAIVSPLVAHSAPQGSSASSQTIDCATSRSLPCPTAHPLIGAHSKDLPAAAAGTGGTMDSVRIAAAWATTRLLDPAIGLILGEYSQGRNFIRDLLSSALRLHGVGCMHLQGFGREKGKNRGRDLSLLHVLICKG
jgi:hypothetical protein